MRVFIINICILTRKSDFFCNFWAISSKCLLGLYIVCTVLMIEPTRAMTRPRFVQVNSSFVKRSHTIQTFKTIKMKKSIGRKFKCKQCGKTFLKANHLDDHVNSVHLKKIFPCHVCEKIFNHRSNLGQHMKKDHPEVNVQLPCDQCKKTFKYKHSLIEHIEKVHHKLEIQ